MHLNIPGFQSKWITKIKEILGETGKMHYWCNQSNLPHHPIKNSIRQSLIDQYKQNWHSSLQTSSKGKHYSLFKSEINLEKYFLILNRNQAIQFAKFRTNNNYLPVETGRWAGIEISERKCELCDKNDIGDSFHYLLVCPSLSVIRKQYIPIYFYNHPNIIKFQQIMSISTQQQLQKISKFVSLIMNRFGPQQN